MTDSAQQRHNMVESQIRPSDITDRRILRGMALLPRERFVPEPLAALAYMDDAVALSMSAPHAPGPLRRMMPPRTLARLIQLARIEPTDVVLDVGTGRGYGAALLSMMAKTVIALEVDVELAAAAQLVLADYPNVTFATGPLAEGHAKGGSYDVIVLEGAVGDQLSVLLSQLKTGGRMVGISTEDGVGRATVWRRSGDTIGHSSAFEASVAALPGFERRSIFVF
jgi:protein-L-isoaspartate(D-aspartate) O-methyltransferase